jgi:ABC-type Fe3+-hydroxamate transport system substrate-binding protein
MIIQDQIGRTLELSTTPKRIISLVPSQTELIVDLGLGLSLVGVTKFCIHPSHIKSNVQVVGGTKNVKLDVIRALNPDIILCNKEENTKEIVEVCEQICPVHVSDIFTIKDALQLISMYGDMFNVNKQASKMIEFIKTEQSDFERYCKNQKTLRVAYFIWKEPWMVAGGNNFINHLLELNKYENVFKTQPRYPEIDINKLQEENIDVLFLSSEPYPFKEKHVEEIATILNNKIVVKIIDGEMFSWYGSKLKKAFNYFKELRNNLKVTI